MLTIKRILLFLIIITFSSESESLDTKAKQAILFDYETNSFEYIGNNIYGHILGKRKSAESSSSIKRQI